MDSLIKIFGKLTDFDDSAISNGDVTIKDAQFSDVYVAKTDEYGNCSLEV